MEDFLSASIKIRATFGSGCLGSFYDIRQNKVLEVPTPEIRSQSKTLYQSPICEIYRGDIPDVQNLLKIIHIDDHQRIKIYLNIDLSSCLGVSSIINHPDAFDSSTRFFYYSWTQRQESLTEVNRSSIKTDGSANRLDQATHCVVAIDYGIDVVSILQLPDDSQVSSSIDRLLDEIRHRILQDNDLTPILDAAEFQLIVKTTVFSNICGITGLKSFGDVIRKINCIRRGSDICHPLRYFLQPVSRFGIQHIEWRPLPQELSEKIESYLLQKRFILKRFQLCRLESFRQAIAIKWFHGTFSIKENVVEEKQKCIEDIKQLAAQVNRFENGKIETNAIETIVQDNQLKTWYDACQHLIENSYTMEAKSYFIRDLIKQHFEYHCVEDDINLNDDRSSVERKLRQADPQTRVLCASDRLNNNDPKKLRELQCSLLEEYRKRPYLRLIYADFSYSTYPLSQMMIFPGDNTDQINTPPPSSSSSSFPCETDIKTPITEKPDDLINILLVGETGVGKSTFINALANYLTFQSLEQALDSEPLVFIPVSFIMTTGDDFHETTVTYGEQECPKNEHFNNQGRSVTQHCQSYTFELSADERRRIRIIDTPGFGDTRGIEQDQLNIEHALDYIRHLSHVNAICFLLKPNQTRMNISFRTCLTQFFSLLPQHGHQSVIFCFTHSRCTFYTPGNTGSLLNQVLKTLNPSNDLKMEKRNTFCFDNEAFRYLVAKRSGIGFSPEEQEEYENSWKMSVEESYRLLNHIEALDPLKMSFSENR